MTVSYDVQDINSWGSSSSIRSVITNGTINAGTLTTNQIDPRELAELKDDSKMLYALIDAGVENWSGYHEALANYRETT